MYYNFSFKSQTLSIRSNTQSVTQMHVPIYVNDISKVGHIKKLQAKLLKLKFLKTRNTYIFL